MRVSITIFDHIHAWLGLRCALIEIPGTTHQLKDREPRTVSLHQRRAKHRDMQDSYLGCLSEMVFLRYLELVRHAEKTELSVR